MIYFILLVSLILVNAYFSAAEIALVSIKKFRIQEEVDKGNKRAGKVLDLLKNPEEYLSSIQIGVTLIGILEGLYGGNLLQAYLEPRLFSWGMPLWSAHALSIVLGIGLITYIAIVVGELLPKSIALQFPQKIALLIIPSFRLFSLIAYPFIKLLTGSTHLLLKLFRVNSSETQTLSDNDLKNLLSLAYRQGTLEKNEFLLHQNIFDFYEQTIEKIMTPIERVILIDEGMTLEMIENIIQNSEHNYFPVVEQKNKVIGYITAKDFFVKRGKPLKEITYYPCMVPRTANAPELLQQFKDHNINFGIVTTGSGELVGVVTMHDIAEVLIGKIA